MRASWSRCIDETVTPEVRVPVTGPDVAVALARLSTTMNQTVAERRADDLLMLHAAALAHPETGRTVALGATSGTGKTSACVALGKTFGYLSDEIAGIAADGSMVPYPKPLSVLTSAGPKTQPSPDELGLARPTDPVRIGAVLLLERSADGPERPELVEVATVDAMAEIAANTFQLVALDRPLQRLAAVLRAVPVRRVRYREAETLGPVLAELLG